MKVSAVSQFMHAPSAKHMIVVYRILKCLKNAYGKCLLFSKNEALDIVGYMDSDWAMDQTNRKTTFGYFTFVREKLVTWRSKKYKVIARSSVEAKF